jgi:hypothetical protein
VFGHTTADSVHKALVSPQQVFTDGATTAFLAAAVFLVLAVSVVGLVVRPTRQTRM